MPLSNSYGPVDDTEAEAVLRRAIELGVRLFDTADIYGMGHNERLLGRIVAGRRGRVFISTKFGHRLDRATSGRHRDGRPEHVRAAVEASLMRLQVDHIDIEFLHRLDPAVPIEDTVGEMARLKAEGKIGALGLSEVDPDTLRRAHAAHPIAALQSEYSLWSREVGREVLPLTRALGITFVAFSPLGRGFLAGLRHPEQGDRRSDHPRFQGNAYEANDRRRRTIEQVARRLDVDMAQVSLAWILSKPVVPIPGTRSIRHLESNWAANDLVLDDATIAELEAAYPIGSTIGGRYPEEQRP